MALMKVQVVKKEPNVGHHVTAWTGLGGGSER